MLQAHMVSNAGSLMHPVVQTLFNVCFSWQPLRQAMRLIIVAVARLLSVTLLMQAVQMPKTAEKLFLGLYMAYVCVGLHPLQCVCEA